MSDGLAQRIRMPHVFALLTFMILACCVLTWVVPAGRYAREQRTVGGRERTVVVPGTFQTVPKHYSAEGVLFGQPQSEQASPVSLEGFLSAIPRGMIEAADIIFFIFIIGGTFSILQRTGTIAAVLHKLLERFRGSWKVLTVVLMTAIAIGGSTLGMGEEFIPLVPVFLVVAKEIDCDRIFGIALVYLAGQVGFAAATTNPFTVNIAQGIAELPLNSALGFRLAFFACAMTVALVHVLRYGARVRKDPSASIMTGDAFELGDEHAEPPPLERSHVAILAASAAIFAFILYAVQEMGWWLPEMAGGFFLMGVVAAAVGRLSMDEAVKAAVRGMEDMVVAALVVGFARGITVVLEQAQILDTLIHWAATLLQEVPRYVAAEGMLAFQTVLNLFIPSGSGQAAVTMPLMTPLADVLGLTRQTAVFAFTCGDGFSNTVIPTSGILMATLGLARVPYDRWLRFMLPLLGQLLALSAVFLALAVAIGLQ